MASGAVRRAGMPPAAARFLAQMRLDGLEHSIRMDGLLEDSRQAQFAVIDVRVKSVAHRAEHEHRRRVALEL